MLLLLEYESDPNLHGRWGGSTIHATLPNRNKVIIRALLTRGADIRYRGGAYCSVLQAAEESENEAVMKIALGSGLSVKEKDSLIHCCELPSPRPARMQS